MGLKKKHKPSSKPRNKRRSIKPKKNKRMNSRKSFQRFINWKILSQKLLCKTLKTSKSSLRKKWTSKVDQNQTKKRQRKILKPQCPGKAQVSYQQLKGKIL